MDEKLQEYRDKFGEQFPLMLVMGVDDSEIIKIITDSINANTPYEPDFTEGVLY